MKLIKLTGNSQQHFIKLNSVHLQFDIDTVHHVQVQIIEPMILFFLMNIQSCNLLNTL